MRVLLVEDEPEMAAAIRTVLERDGYVVDQVTSLAELREVVSLTQAEVVLLDRTLPDGDGIVAITDLRREVRGAPVIVITARAHVSDRVAGLDAGADDYLPKPFAMEEMLARIRAVRRRPNAIPQQLVELGGLVYDMNNDEALVRGQRLDLPRRELRVLATLMRRRGRTVLRRTLEEAVYGLDDEVQPNALDPHISRLRKRLVEVEAQVEIHTIRGVGYLLRHCS